MIIHLLLGLAFITVYIGGFLWWVRCMIQTEYRQFYRGLVVCVALICLICWAASQWGLQ